MASRYGGYMGRVALVDLAKREVSEYPWSDEERELYIGGKTMAAKILLDNLSPAAKPFSDDNMLVVATGPLTGTGAPSTSRFDISTLSPQTGILASSNCGGRFGYYLKKAGYDALILKGRSKEPLWLNIVNDCFELRSADDLWGLRTSEAQQKLSKLITERTRHPDKSGKLVIGPAGENLVKYSSIVSDERVAGRAGAGAVMGWMNLKAVTASGNHTVKVSDPEKMLRWNRKWFKYIRNHPLTGDQLPRIGTAGLVSAMHMRGLLSTKNYEDGRFDGFERVSGEELAEKYNIVNKGCLTCPIKCARTVEVDGKQVKGPELETLGLLGGGILNADLPAIIRWNYELDELGMDTISAASTLAWAMEANEKGIWINGLEFGKTEGITNLFNDIAYRRGIGDELAEGSRALAKKYGGMEFAIQSKGLELAAYEPRRAVGQGLGYAVSNRGGCHLNGGYLVILEGLGLSADTQTPKAKADFTMMFQDLLEMISATGQCLFTSYAFFPSPLVKHPNAWYTRAVNRLLPHLGWAGRAMNKFPLALALNLPVFHHTKGFKYATGMPMNFGKYLRCGERGYNLERYVNTEYFGVTARDDSLPKKLTDVPQDPNDPSTVVPLEIMKKKYYRARGWSADGVPTERTLRKLKIPFQKQDTRD